MKTFRLCCVCVAFAVLASPVLGADFLGLEEGAANLKTAGQLTFGPYGVLFVGDAKAATVYALDTGDKEEVKGKKPIFVDDLNKKLATTLGVDAASIQVNDLAVNPLSGNVYLSLAVGGDKASPAIVRINSDGDAKTLSLDKINHSKFELPNAPEDKVVKRGRRSSNRRDDSITDLAFVDGNVLISGLSDGDSPSSVRSVAFPFAKNSQTSSLQIYHGAHGKYEDYSAIRTFVPFTIDGKPNLLAGFICTPLVKFPISDVKSGAKIKGTTVAELGNRNKPYDMIVYKKDGKNYLLMANSDRGVMKINTSDIERDKGITERVGRGETAGQTYKTISDWKNVVQLDQLDEYAAVIVTDDKQGHVALTTLELP